MKFRRLKAKILTSLYGFFTFLIAKTFDDNFSFTVQKETALKAWNCTFPILINIFFASCCVFAALGIQYLFIHSRNFFQQLGFYAIILLAIVLIFSFANSKDPKQRLQALGLSIVVLFAIGFLASLKANQVKVSK